MNRSLQRHIVVCPHCGKQALDHMTKCPSCGGTLTPKGYVPMTEEKRKKIKRVATVIAVIGCVAALAWVFARRGWL